MKKKEILYSLENLENSLKYKSNKSEIDVELVFDCLLDTIEELKFIVMEL